MIALFLIVLIICVIFGSGFIAPLLATYTVGKEKRNKRRKRADRIRSDQRFNRDRKRMKANTEHVMTLDHNWDRK